MAKKRGWLQTFMDIGAAFDWITPIADVVQDLLKGPPHQIVISSIDGDSPRHVAQMLNRAGIDTWGLGMEDGNFVVTVSARQAQMAEYLLDQAGVTVDNPGPRAERPAGEQRQAEGEMTWGMDQIW